MAFWYGVTCVVSFLLLVLCIIAHRKENPILLLLFIALSVTNLGYFALSVSPNLKFALFSNGVSYLGSVFLPVFMLLIIKDLCKVHVPKWLVGVMSVLGLTVFIIASSGGYSNVYYESVALDHINGATILEKTYGPLHPIYKVYVITYLLTMIAIIIYSFVRKSNKNIKVSSFLSFIVSVIIGVWLAESIIGSYFEYLSVAYVVSEILLLMFYGIIRDYNNTLTKSQQVVKEPAVVYFTENEAYKIISQCQLDNLLSNRELEVTKLLLEGKRRKDIAEELFVTESTIKKHSANIYRKLEVENRKELVEKFK